MTIRTLVQLTLAAGALAVSVVILILLWATYAHKDFEEKKAGIYSLVQGIAELEILAHEYLPRAESRPLIQWKMKHARIEQTLRRITTDDAESQQSLSYLLARHSRVKELFARVEQMNSGLPRGAEITPAILAQRDYLLSELFVNLQDQLADASELRRKTIAGEEQAGRQALRAAGGVSFLLLATVAILVWTVTRRLSSPLDRLLVATEKIGAGDLGHRIASASGDEMGALSQAIDKMAQRLQDVTASREELRHSHARYTRLVDASAAIVWNSDLDGKFLGPIQGWERYTGQTWEQYSVTLGFDAVHPDDRTRVVEVCRQAFANEQDYEIKLRLWHAPSASFRHVIVRGLPIRNSEGRVTEWVGTMTDVHDLVEAQEKLQVAAKALENTVEAVIIARDGTIASVNRAFSSITGYSSSEVIGKHVSLLRADQLEGEQSEALLAGIDRDGFGQGEIRMLRKSGEVYPAWVSISAVNDEITGRFYVSVFSDISAAKAAEDQLQHLAHHDALTGLPNRTLLQLRLEDGITRAERNRHVLGVLFIDLDRFKPINDALGHDAGDELLRLVAERLNGCVRTSDTVARLGGDEFAVLLDELHCTDEAGLIARNMLDVLSQPFMLRGQPQYISGSIGVSCYPQDGTDAGALLKHADVAMYQAKQEGRDAYRFFSSEMNVHAAEKLYLANSLRLALERGELLLNFQPRFCLSTDRIVGIEALVRWQHPEQGLILPARFISLAEETGLIQPLGEWVLSEAARQFRAWRNGGLKGCRISVNLSARQFAHPGLVERISTILHEAGLSPQDLELEITESIVMQNPELADQVLSKLVASGITVSVDDFGTGYSSLAYLKRFPVSCLKIDRTFVADIGETENDGALVQAVISMARSLRLGVVAEGVENAIQKEFLRTNQCEMGQGNFLSPPLDADAMKACIEGRTQVGQGMLAL